MHTLRAVALATSMLLSSLAAQTTGAIHTTNRTGSQVDGNIYGQDRDVYLSGGPGPNAPCSAAGLPAGNYYFQVTDPSGSLLLSLDTIQNREVVVQGGVIRSHVTGTHRT